MKRSRVVFLVSTALALVVAASSAETGTRLVRQPRAVSRPGPAGSVQLGQRVGSATAAGYSVQLNIVTRVVGLAFYRTAVDITNNTANDGVSANYQYCYTVGGVYQGCTNAATINLNHYDSFHTDDIVDYMGQQGQVPPAAADASFGTFIVTFSGLPSPNGWEGTLTGRTYNAADNANPAAGTVAIAYPGSLFFESSTGSLVAIVRDTTLAPTDAGALRTNLGVTNTGLNNTTPGATVDFRITFYDVATGNVVGSQLAPSHPLAAGEVLQINDVFSAAHIPTDVVSCIAFVDVTSAQDPAHLDTIEGYVDILDGGTNDGAYFEFKCAVGCANY